MLDLVTPRNVIDKYFVLNFWLRLYVVIPMFLSIGPVESGVQPSIQQRTTSAVHTDSPSGTPVSMKTPNPPVSGGTPTPVHFTPPPPPPPTNADTLLDLLRRYPVMWQGLFALKNDSAAVQMHFLSGMLMFGFIKWLRLQL